LAIVYKSTRLRDVRGAPKDVVSPSFRRGLDGSLTVHPTHASVSQYAVGAVGVVRGAVKLVQRDGRRWSISGTAERIATLCPDLSMKEVEEKARVYVGTRRTRESVTRSSLVNPQASTGDVTLECRGCGAAARVKVAALQSAGATAIESCSAVYVSPSGRVSNG
jgi:hypothetical protein